MLCSGLACTWCVGRNLATLSKHLIVVCPQGLQLARAKLSHEKQLVEAQDRVAQLEAHLKHLESQVENVSNERIILEEKSTKKSWWW